MTRPTDLFNSKGEKFLLTFYVKDSWVEMDSSTSDVDIRVKIVLKRRLSQHFLGIFLPSLCIIIIAQVVMIISIKRLSKFNFRQLCISKENISKLQFPSPSLQCWSCTLSTILFLQNSRRLLTSSSLIFGSSLDSFSTLSSSSFLS